MTAPDWLFSLWLIPLGLMLLRVMGLPRPGVTSEGEGTGPLGWGDLALALSSGLVVAGLASGILIHAYLASCGISAPDLEEFCTTVHGLRSGSPQWVERQAGAGLLPASLSTVFGFLDGLALGALLSSFVIGAAHYLWGRLLLGPLAGIAAALLGLTFSPLVVMTRHMTFYPEATAGFVLCGLAGTFLLVRPGPRGLFVAGLGVGVALFVDFVGLVFSAPVALIALVAILRAPGRRARALGLALFLAPVALSFVAARAYVPRTMSGFEEEIQSYLQDIGATIPLLGPELLGAPGAAMGRPSAKERVDGAVVVGVAETGDHWIFRTPLWLRARLPALHADFAGRSYIWGHTPPWALPGVLLRVGLFSLTQQPPDRRFAAHGERNVHEDRAVQVLPWVPLLLGALGLAIFSLRRDPWRLVGWMFILLPFALSLRYQAETRVLPRFLMAPFSPMPVLLGVAFAGAVTHLRPASKAWARGLTGGMLTLLLLAVVVGALPSYLSPKAPWRAPVETMNAALMKAVERSAGWQGPLSPGARPEHSCEWVVRGDLRLGRAPWGRIFPYRSCTLGVRSDAEEMPSLVEQVIQRLPRPEGL